LPLKGAAAEGATATPNPAAPQPEAFLHVDTVPLGVTSRSEPLSSTHAFPNASPAIAVGEVNEAATPLTGPSSSPAAPLPARVAAMPPGATLRIRIVPAAVVPTKMVKLVAFEEMPKPRGVSIVATVRLPLAAPAPPLKAHLASVHVVLLEGKG
jgi:hypothetical protein